MREVILLNKDILTIGITIGITIWIIIPINYVSSSTKIGIDEVIGSATNTNSFHMNISGQKYWFSIKITTLVPTNMTIEYSRYILYYYKTMEYHSMLLHGQNSSYMYLSGSSGYKTSEVDYYFQINLGRLNRSYYHYNKKYFEEESGSHVLIGYSPNLTGTYYFTFFSYCDCKESTLDIWINTSHDVLISTTQGKDVFFFKREDFYGNINMGFQRGTIILNGVKEIKINNSMFTWFRPDSEATGFEVLEYQSPTGDYKRRRQVDKRGEPINYNFSEVRDFEEGLWWAPKGKWIFKTTMIKIGKIKCCPTVYLFGADIKLPD